MSQPARTCGCAGKRCGNPCKPVLQPPKKSGGEGGCNAGASGCGRGDRSGSMSCGSAGGCGCLGPFPQKTKPTK